MFDQPYISVIIPVFNRIKYVEEAINSVLIQPEVAEVVVVDDGSKDGSLELCLKLQQNNSKIKIFTHKRNKNKGIAASRNLGVKYATSEWIAFLDSDDYYLPNRFTTVSEIIRKDRTIDGVYSSSQQFVEDTNELKGCGGIKKQVNPEDLFTTLIEFNYGSFDTPSIVLRKELIFKVGGFEDRIKNCDDTQMWYKAALVGKIVSDKNQNPLAMVRIHESNIWNGKQEKYIFYHSHFLMFYYGLPLVLKHGELNQQQVYLNQLLKDYRIYFRLLPKEFKGKWFRDVYPKVLKLVIDKKLQLNHPKFIKQLREWNKLIIRTELKRKKDQSLFFVLQLIPKTIKEKLKSHNE